METERGNRLAEFSSWVQANIRGDEKGEAQVSLDRFFQALGDGGVKEAGAILEMRLKKNEGRKSIRGEEIGHHRRSPRDP